MTLARTERFIYCLISGIYFVGQSILPIPNAPHWTNRAMILNVYADEHSIYTHSDIFYSFPGMSF